MSYKIGAGSAYYGGADPRHVRSTNGFLAEGIPFVAIKGCAYPEMARSHITAQAMEYGVDCVVICDPDVAFDPAEARRMAETAIRRDAIVTATLGCSKSGPVRRYVGRAEPPFPRYLEGAPWEPDRASDLAFAAVPLSALRAMAEKDSRDFSNSPIVRTMLSKENRPFFSPWRPAPGTLDTTPVSSGIYVNPDRAFLLRAQAVGVPILSAPAVKFQMLGGSGYSVRLYAGDAELRAQHGIPNYCLCVPAFGALDLSQQKEIFELEKAGVAIAELHGCPFIDLARSELSRLALEELGCDGVFFLDHDIMFRPVDMISICREAEERQDVVAAAYCMRKSAHSLIGAIDETAGTTINFFEGGAVHPALYAGLGFAAIPKCVYEVLGEKYPLLDAGMPGEVCPLFALDVNGGYYAGEDVSFCSRVQGLTVRHFPSEHSEMTPNSMDWEHVRTSENPTGHRVWIDTRVRIAHKGSYEFGIEDVGIVVPRYQRLEANVCKTRAEVRDVLKRASDLSIETQMRVLGLDDEATSVHPIIAENEERAANVRVEGAAE